MSTFLSTENGNQVEKTLVFCIHSSKCSICVSFAIKLEFGLDFDLYEVNAVCFHSYLTYIPLGFYRIGLQSLIAFIKHFPTAYLYQDFLGFVRFRGNLA